MGQLIQAHTLHSWMMDDDDDDDADDDHDHDKDDQEGDDDDCITFSLDLIYSG